MAKEKNSTSLIKLKTTSKSSATNGTTNCDFVNLFKPLAILSCLPRYRMHNIRLRHVLAHEFAHYTTIPHHDEPRTGSKHLLNFG
jgi:hypothetical protein